MLSKFEFDKILEALWHAERNADHFNKHVWKRMQRRANEELLAIVEQPEQLDECVCQLNGSTSSVVKVS